jgi:lysophospholipase L1-like esterase
MGFSASRAIAAVVFVASVWACQDEPAQPTATPALPAATQVRVLALGDSYTIGELVAPEKSWPRQLADSLLADSVRVVGPTIVAQTGWTTADLLDASADLDGSFHLVTLQIGVNNQFRALAFDVYEREFPVLIDRAIALAHGSPARVIVLSIPDYSATPFGRRLFDPEGTIAGEIDTYNDFARAVSEASGVVFVDVTDISRRALDEQELVASDGLHPSAQMYALWVARLLPTVRSILVPRPGLSSVPDHSTTRQR